jgi:hypothetical protein
VHAQIKLALSFGFNGRFLPDHLTPVFVTVTNQGLAVSGQLEFHQNIENPLQGSYKQSLQYTVDLEAEATKRFEFQIFVHGYIYPVIVRFRSGELTLAEVPLDLREMFVDEKFSLGLSDPSMAKRLPGGQAIEPIALQALPTHWVGFDSVHRIYLARIDTNLLTKPQQDAIRHWVLWGGELIVLGGENWRVQRSPWLADLIPLRIEAIQTKQWNESEITVAIGQPKDETYEIIEQKDDVILSAKRPYGLGSVLFYSVDPLKTNLVNLPIKPEQKLAALQLWDQLNTETGKNLLNAVSLQYPNRGLLALLLGALVLGFALSSMALLRRSLSQRVYASIIVVLFLGGSALVGAYVQQPIYTNTLQSVELSVERLFAQTDHSVQQTWYSLFTERGSSFELELPQVNSFVRQANSHPNDLAMRLSDEAIKAEFYVLAQQQAHFMTEEVRPARVAFTIDTAVRPMKVSVYNNQTTALGPGIIRLRGQSYQIGGVAAGESKTFFLTTKLEEKELADASETDSNLSAMKKKLYQDVLKAPQEITVRHVFIPGRGWRPVRATLPGVSEPATQAIWFAWGQSELFSTLPGENRLRLKLYIIGEGGHVAE